jgi:hypothetical protein
MSCDSHALALGYAGEPFVLFFVFDIREAENISYENRSVSIFIARCDP